MASTVGLSHSIQSVVLFAQRSLGVGAIVSSWNDTDQDVQGRTMVECTQRRSITYYLLTFYSSTMRALYWVISQDMAPGAK